MSLGKLRQKQEKIDLNILSLLEKRFEVSEKIGIHKRKNKLEVEDNNVETTKIDNLMKKSPSKILDRGFLEQVWGHIFAKSKEIQRKIQVDQNEEK